MEILKLISANEIVAQLVCFLIVFFLLRSLLWGRFMKILEDRRLRIVQDMQQIEETKKSVAALQTDFEGKLKNIEQIAAVRLQEVVVQGEEVAAEIKDRARLDAQRIVSEAKAEIEQTVIKTKEELKKQVIDLTLLATEKIIEEKMTSETDRKMITNFINQLEKENA